MNVIVLINDTFRRDHLGCYGNQWIQTPNLDRFAEGAAIFDRYYAASYPTVPNRWDLSTGRFGFPHLGWQPLNPEDESWGQLLSNRVNAVGEPLGEAVVLVRSDACSAISSQKAASTIPSTLPAREARKIANITT